MMPSRRLHVTSLLDRGTMGDLLDYGRKAQPRAYANGFACYPQFNIFYITVGELLVVPRSETDEGLRPVCLRPGQLLVLPPGSAFDLSTPKRPYRGHFTEALPERCPCPPRIWTGDWDARVAATIAEIEREHGDQADAAVLPLLYGLLFHRAVRQVQTALQPGGGPEDLPALIDSRLRAHVFTAADVAEILAPLPWSLRHLRRRYVAARGCSPKRALDDYKMAAARRLLSETSASVTAIAIDLGFPSSQHFATRFKAHCGRSPSAWRRDRG